MSKTWLPAEKLYTEGLNGHSVFRNYCNREIDRRKEETVEVRALYRATVERATFTNATRSNTDTLLSVGDLKRVIWERTQVLVTE